MKKTIIITALIASVAMLSFKSTEPSTYSMDRAHSKLAFIVTHLLISDVEGNFKIVDSKITATKEDLSDAVIELSADVNSINTDNEQRDTHLKSPDFFDAAKFSTINFKSKSFTKVEGKKYKLTGDLTMHNVTKEVVLDVVMNGPVVHPMTKKTIVAFKITGTIKRSDFKIGATMPESIVSDEVRINTSTEFVKN